MKIQCNLMRIDELEEGQLFLDHRGRKVRLIELSPSCALVRYKEPVTQPGVEEDENVKPQYRYRTETWSLASPATPIEE